MKRTVNQAQLIKSVLRLKIEKREKTYENRTEYWKSTNRADKYERKTYELISALDDINRVIDSLENYISR